MVSCISKSWTWRERHAVIASYLSWSFDAFDYFILVFVLRDVAKTFDAGLTEVAFATTLTLALRPLGAFIFGRLADWYGRRPILVINIAAFSILGFATAFSRDVVEFLIIRALFGVAMGGVWGVSASLALETVKPRARGFVSGLLQAGYPTGYLIAALIYALFFDLLGWRGLFVLSLAPAILTIIYINLAVLESPGWSRQRGKMIGNLVFLGSYWRLVIYAVILMTAFNFFAHGTQDIYPTFLQRQHGLDRTSVGAISIIYNVGAIGGGIIFGFISQRLGRKYTVAIAALLSLPVVFLWAYAPTPVLLGIGAFSMQFLVQGAWAGMPAYLNEISPAEVRGTFPGTVYQIGGLISSINLPLQLAITDRTNGNFGIALTSVAVCSAVAIIILIFFGPETRSKQGERLKKVTELAHDATM